MDLSKGLYKVVRVEALLRDMPIEQALLDKGGQSRSY